jgi:cytochrome c
MAAIVSSFAPARAYSNKAGQAFQEIKIEAGQKLYEIECRRFHRDDFSDPSGGLELIGVVGRRAGSEERNEFSDALVNSGIVWTPAAPKAWMADNDGFMPGTKMCHVGIEDPTVQDFILAYLETLSA